MNSMLNNYIIENCQNMSPKRLPLMHSCPGYTAVQIMRENILKASHCPIFKKDYLYFFYGKPVYSANHDLLSQELGSSLLPVCFIIDPNKIYPCKVYPFDSGAYVKGRYNNEIFKTIDIDTYELNNSFTSIEQFISVFYGSNINYFYGEVKDILPEASHIEISSFIELQRSKNIAKFDERAITIEIITNHSYILSDIVECVVLPNSLLKDITVMKWLNENNINYRCYRARQKMAPNRLDEIVVQETLKILKEREYFNE